MSLDEIGQTMDEDERTDEGVMEWVTQSLRKEICKVMIGDGSSALNMPCNVIRT